MEIERDLTVNRDTCRKIYDRWKKRQTCENAPRSGRPEILSERDIHEIEDYIRTDRHTRRQPLQETINVLNISVCPKTLRSAIIKYTRLGHRIERSSPWLSSEQKSARLAFAMKYAHWNLDEWRRVIFTDEMSIQTSGNRKEGRYVWRYPEEEYLEDCCAATVIPGFERVKVWGGMRYNKLSKLIVLPEKKEGGKLNAEEYCEVILDGELFEFWMKGMEEEGYMFVMEDGASYHQGVATKRRKQLEVDGWLGWGSKTWPANSPDLNPIENLWHILRYHVRKRKVQPKNKKELIAALEKEWNKLDMEIVNNLIDSMPRRLQIVIEAKGGYSGY